MSFELGLLMGLGRSALKERDERTRKQREEQDLAEKQSQRSLGMLQKLVETDDLLPDEARNVAAQNLFRLSTNPKAKDTDYSKAIQEVFTAANQPRPTPQTVAANAVRNIVSTDTSNLVPPPPATVPRLPEPEFRSGILSRDEINERGEVDLRRKLALQQEYSGTKVTPFSDTQGLYDNTTDRVVREPNPKAATPDRSLTPFEVLYNLATTDDERRKIATDALRMQSTNWGDTPRPSGGGVGSPGAAVLVDTPNGPAFVFPKLMNPGGAGMVPLPTGATKPLTATAADKRAQLQLMLNDVNMLIQAAPDMTESIGRWDAMKVGAKEWLGIGNDPQTADLYATADNLASVLINARSGAAVSPAEFKRLERFLPNPRKPQVTFEVQLQRFKRELEFILEKRYGVNGVGDAAQFPGDVGSPLEQMTGGARRPTTSAAPRTAPAPAAPGRLPAPPPPPGYVPVGQ